MREVVGWAVMQGPVISSLHLLMLEQFRPRNSCICNSEAYIAGGQLNCDVVRGFFAKIEPSKFKNKCH